MFKLLKAKLKQWTERLAKSPKPSEEEKIPKKEAQKKKARGKKVKGKKEIEIPLPMKFNAGLEEFEPDFERLKEDIHETEEEAKPGTKSFFQKIKEKAGKVRISEEEFEKYKEELEILLLENNVAFEVVDTVIKELKEEIVGKDLLKKEIGEQIKEALSSIISKILIQPFDLIDKIRAEEKPFVILFFGINGSGKTTTIAKIARFLGEKKISCVMAAADTFRAASIEQLKEHGKRINVPVVAHEYGSDPASVGFDAINYAKKKGIKCILIDTAGRMHTEKNLIREMEKIVHVCRPDLKIFIGESITGNDATEQARVFNSDIGIDGIILAKSDIDEKGGTALSVGYVTGKPILFLGTGQAYSNLEQFNKNKFLEKLGL